MAVKTRKEPGPDRGNNEPEPTDNVSDHNSEYHDYPHFGKKSYPNLTKIVRNKKRRFNYE